MGREVGAVAQLVERIVRNDEVESSNLFRSTSQTTSMPKPPEQAPLAVWALVPRLAVARELSIDPSLAGSLVALVRRRQRPRVFAVAAIQIAVMVGWLWLLSAPSGFYRTTTTFSADGQVIREVSSGPMGITVFPLFFAVLLGPFLALALGVVAGIAAHFWLIDRESRRCARTPACFACGYDLSASVAGCCSECGQSHPALAVPPSGAARTVRP